MTKPKVGEVLLSGRQAARHFATGPTCDGHPRTGQPRARATTDFAPSDPSGRGRPPYLLTQGAATRPLHLLTYLIAYHPTYLITYLLKRLRTCLPATAASDPALHAHLLTSLSAYLLLCLAMSLPNYLLTCVLAVAASDRTLQTYLFTHLPPRLSSYVLTYLPASL